MKTFLNNEKIPCIPPIYQKNNYFTDFKEKAQIFNGFFARQCTLVENSSKLLTNSNKRTNKLISTNSFTKDDIAKIIKNLNPNKVHGFDMISIHMIKICGESILKSLELIFKSCLENGKFPNKWKKANVVPVHKINNKQLIENYRPISLLPVCGKILELLICNEMFEFFTENELISQNQSGFKPGDSCISQLLCMTHDIYQSLDYALETTAVFLDISKAFDKVWHEGLLFKLKLNGISGNLLNVITDFLYQRKQRVILNGQHSSWNNVQARVPQGSILSPLFFLVYINDLSDGLNSNPKLFADDTSLFSVVQNINSTANDLNSDLIKISDWAFQWKMRFNSDPKKQAQEVICSRKINKTDHLPLYFNENLVKSSSTQKHLGMILDTKVDFSLHLKNVQNKVNKTIGLLRKLQDTLPRTSLITIFKSFIRPHLDYGDIIYDRAYNTSFHQNIESVLYNAALAITDAVRGTSREKLYQELGFESLQQRRWYRKLCCLFKIMKSQSPSYLFQLVPSRNSENIP